MAIIFQPTKDGKREAWIGRGPKEKGKIAELKDEVSSLYAKNEKLEKENIKLRLRNAEVEAAYKSLKEILRRRGVATP